MNRDELLRDPLKNKGTAFTDKERTAFKLHGFLPYHVSTIEEQVQRRYTNFCEQQTEIAKYSFLSALQNRNEVLYYRLVLDHLSEMLPLIYTPTVGEVSTVYSLFYHENRGLFLSYPHRDKIAEIIDNISRSKIDIIVVTDGERILGLGDLGIGGMTIPIGKLSLYTLFGGIHPSRTLPILLDVGTNNKKLLDDPLYLGWRHERITGKEYESFVDQFVRAIKKRFPQVLLQWEDFGKAHAYYLLEKYRDQICSFNDDIQGTAAVTLAALLTAVRKSGTKLKDQKIAILGGGSAGMGICNKLLKAVVQEGGIGEEEARKLFYIVDVHGLIHSEMAGVTPEQRQFAQNALFIKTWKIQDPTHVSLLDVVENVHPTILIGVSTQGGAFSEEIIRTMAQYVRQPIIFPLSNPTSSAEAHPADLLRWTHGKAIIATGSPFGPVIYDGEIFHISQCNNVYVFPAIGLGVIASKASRISDAMFLTAAQVLSKCAAEYRNAHDPLLPPFEELRSICREMAIAVGQTAQEEGLAPASTLEELSESVDATMWFPNYE